MFKDYSRLIMEDYKQKAEKNLLSLSLIKPTPKGIKEECLRLCTERFSTKDQKTLRDFFGNAQGQKEAINSINELELEKIKPLINLLKGQTSNPESKNIELLAWLIDFQPRPFELGKKYPEKLTDQELEPFTGTDGSVNLISGSAAIQKSTFKLNNGFTVPVWVRTLSWAVLSIAVIGFFWNWKTKKPEKNNLVSSTGCMYWTGIHYKQTDCNQAHGDTLLIALNAEKIATFKRITQPDTITLHSVGKLWYIKRKNNLEFYTAGGNHPEDPNRKLRPLTAYMIKKYILDKQKTPTK